MSNSGSGENTQTSADHPSALHGSECVLESGSVIKDRYRIVEQIGRGGFGTVYLAEDQQLLSKRVVVKILSSSSESNSWSRKKFRSEMEALSRIDHPGIVTLLDAGETGDGLPFLVMQYIEGGSLRSRITNQGLSMDRASHLIRQIGRGLAAAHQQGVFHRDLKPENLMIRTGADGLETAKIIDFGIATVSNSLTVSDRQSTVVAGTANYMAPEQLLGKPTLHSDIYALGVIAYEIVTGRVPYYATTYAMLFALQQRGAVVKPKDLRPDLPEAAQTLILQALAFRPEDRPGDAAAFGDSLADAIAADEPSHLFAAQTVTLQPAGSWPKRPTSRLLGWLAACALVVVAAGLIAYWRYSRPSPVPSIAVMPFTNTAKSEALEYVSQGLTDGIVNTLGRLPKLQVSGRMAIPQFRNSQPDARAVGQMLKVDTVLGGSVTETNGVMVINAELVDARTARHLWGQRYERKRSEFSAVQEDICLEVASQLRVALTSQDKRALVKRFTTNPQAEQLYLQGRFFWNRRKADDRKTAVEYFNKSIELDPNYALPYAGLADALITQSGSAPPKQVMPQAELAAMKAIDKDDELAAAHAALASIKLHYEWDWLQTEKQYKRAIELDPSLAQAHSWYAVYLWVMKRFDEALAESRRAQELEPTSLPIRLGVARSLTMAGRYDEALQQYREVLKMYPSAIGTYVEIGLLYERKGQLQEALAEYTKVWKRSELPDDSGPLTTMGHLYAKLGRRQEALDAVARLQAISQKRYVSPCEIATVQGALGDKDAAFQSLNQCYDDRSWQIIFLQLDPGFAELRSDPRYDALVRKLKIS